MHVIRRVDDVIAKSGYGIELRRSISAQKVGVGGARLSRGLAAGRKLVFRTVALVPRINVDVKRTHFRRVYEFRKKTPRNALTDAFKYLACTATRHLASSKSSLHTTSSAGLTVLAMWETRQHLMAPAVTSYIRGFRFNDAWICPNARDGPAEKRACAC